MDSNRDIVGYAYATAVAVGGLIGFLKTGRV